MLEIQKYVRNAGPAQTRVLALPISLHEKQYGCIKHHLHNKGIFLFLLSLSLSIYIFIFYFYFKQNYGETLMLNIFVKGSLPMQNDQFEHIGTVLSWHVKECL